jgi:uncharacterized membrane protein
MTEIESAQPPGERPPRVETHNLDDKGKNRHPRKRADIGMLIMSAMILAYIIGFAATTFKEYNSLWYGNFDLGIPDQGVWMISRLHNPYLTTRGLHLFGDHATYIHLLIAPIYWVWDDVRALLLVQTVALALGALPVYLLAKDKFQGKLTALVFPFSYLMLPALHFSNLDAGHHFESLPVPLILLGYWALTRRKFRLYYATTFLSLICKEEIAITFMLYGAYIAYKHDRRVGIMTSSCAAAYLLLVMYVLLPYFNQEGSIYADRTVGSFGKNPSEALSSVTNPSFMIKKFDTEANRGYMRALFEPTGYLILLEPLAIASSGSLWLNLINDWPYAHLIRYHYVTPIIPFIYIALIEGIGRFRKNKRVKAALLTIVLASAVLGNANYSPSQSNIKSWGEMADAIGAFNQVPQESAAIVDAMGKIPKNASVSAAYNLVSHLSHRERAYMFPNPFRVTLYGINDGGIPPDRETDYIVIDSRTTADEERKEGTFTKVTKDGRYRLVWEESYYSIWKKV